MQVLTFTKAFAGHEWTLASALDYIRGMAEEMKHPIDVVAIEYTMLSTRAHIEKDAKLIQKKYRDYPWVWFNITLTDVDAPTFAQFFSYDDLNHFEAVHDGLWTEVG